MPNPKPIYRNPLVILAAVVIIALTLWVGWGVWQDSRENGGLAAGTAAATAGTRLQFIPTAIGNGIVGLINPEAVAGRPPEPVAALPTPEPTATPAPTATPPPTATPIRDTPTPLPTVDCVTPTATPPPPPAATAAPNTEIYSVIDPASGVMAELTKAQLAEFNRTGQLPGAAAADAANPAAAGAASLPADSGLPQWRQYMLALINAARQEAGLSPVALGSNDAAQQHAAAMLEHNFVGHWSQDGLPPYARYTRAGGVNYVRENTAGSVLQEGLTYRAHTPQESIDSLHQGFMRSPRHRENILNPWHKQVNLGIACSDFSCSVAQHFAGDYVEFSAEPVISPENNALSFAGSLKDGFTMESVQVWYDRPPHPLTLGQLDVTHSYNEGERPATFLLKPAPAGCFYSAAALAPAPFRWDAATNPYDVPPEQSRTLSTIQLRPPLYPKSRLVPWTQTERWQVEGADFAVAADLSETLAEFGPGIYTVYILGRKDGEKIALTNYSIFVAP